MTVIEEDGSQGYGNAAPYDSIIVTAACPEIPKPLIEQLKDGGTIIAPVGGLTTQEMIKLRKKGNTFGRESLGEFMFLPLVGKNGFKEEDIEPIGPED